MIARVGEAHRASERAPDQRVLLLARTAAATTARSFTLEGVLLLLAGLGLLAARWPTAARALLLLLGSVELVGFARASLEVCPPRESHPRCDPPGGAPSG